MNRVLTRIIRSTGLLLAVCVALFACKRAELTPDGEWISDGEILRSFAAEFPDDMTQEKAYVDISDLKTCWENGDKVRVFNGKTSAIFTYSAGYFTNPDGLAYDSGCGYAMVYPSTLSDGSFTMVDNHIQLELNLPSVQTYTDGKCRNIPLVAYAGSGKWTGVYFKQLCGMLRFSLKGDSVKGAYTGLSFTGTGACGNITVPFSGTSGEGFVPSYTKPDASATVSIANLPASTNNVINYYMYLPTGSYASPTVKVDYTDKSDIERTAASFTVSRAQVIKASNYFQTLYSGGGTDGTDGSDASHPYLIKTQQDLEELRANVANTQGKYYRLCNDIALTGTWTPIGSSATNCFQGTFDGRNSTNDGNYTISGISINRPSNGHCGLFGYVGENGVIKFLNVDCRNTAYGVRCGQSNVGMLVGSLYGRIQNCNAVGGTVHGEANSVGGLVGQVQGNGVVETCSAYANVTVEATGKESAYVGGIAGSVLGTSTLVNNCTSRAFVSSEYNAAGGIAGQLGGSGRITNCQFLPTSTVKERVQIQSYMQVGGITGICYSKTADAYGAIYHCRVGKYAYIKATRDSENSNGGLVGGICGMQRYGKINYCLFEGKVEAYASVGGIVGHIRSNEINETITVSIVNCQAYSCTIKVLGQKYASQCGGILGIAAPHQTTGNSYNCTILNCLVNYANFETAYDNKNQLNDNDHSAIGGIVGRTRCEGTTKIHNSCVCLANSAVKYPNSAMTKHIYYGGILGWASANTTVKVENNVVYTWKPLNIGGNQAELDNSGDQKTLGVGGAVGYADSNIKSLLIRRAFIANNYLVPLNYGKTSAQTANVTIEDYIVRILNGNIGRGPLTEYQPPYYGPSLTATSGKYTWPETSTYYVWDFNDALTFPTGNVFDFTPTTTKYYKGTTLANLYTIVNNNNAASGYSEMPAGSSKWYNLDDTAHHTSDRKLNDAYYYPVPVDIAWPDSF